MERIQEYLDLAKAWYDAREAREQRILLVGGGLLVLMLGYSMLSSLGAGLSGRRGRIAEKAEALNQAKTLAVDYASKRAAADSEARQLSRPDAVDLVERVEKARDSSGIELPSFRPKEGTPNDQGLVESTVELETKGVSIDRLEAFLNALHKQPGKVVVRKIEVSKTRNADTLDAEMWISSYRLKK